MRAKKKIPDIFLVQKALIGDQKAFTELYNRYHNYLLYRLTQHCRDRDLAEDLTMETMEKAFLVLETYSPQFTFGTWLFRMGVNLAIDNNRKANKSPISHIIDGQFTTDNKDDDVKPMQVADMDNHPLEDMIQRQQLGIIKKCLNHIQELQKKCLELRYFEGLSYDEIAETLEIAVGTVKSNINRGKRALRTYITKHYKDDFI